MRGGVEAGECASDCDIFLERDISFGKLPFVARFGGLERPAFACVERGSLEGVVEGVAGCA